MVFADVTGAISTRLRASLAAGADVFRVADLRRLQFAYLASLLALWSFSVAASVYAFDIGGAGLVGVLMLSRMIPAALVSPFTATLADRYPRRLVMLSTDLLRAAVTAAAAASIWLDLPPATVFVLTGILLLVSTAFEPAKNALLPDLAPDPAQLTASNVVTNTFESASMFAGPALGGLLLAVGSVPLVFVVSAGLLLVSATLLARLPAERERASGADAGEGGEGSELTAGIRTVLGDD